MKKPETKPYGNAEPRERGVPVDVDPAAELPRHRHVYSPPKPLASLVSHETLDMRSVRLAPEIDPRRAPTMLSLRPVQVVVRPPMPTPTRQFLSLSGALLLIALAVLPGTVVWLVRTHGLLGSVADFASPAFAGNPSGEPESAVNPAPPPESPEATPAVDLRGPISSRRVISEHTSAPLPSQSSAAPITSTEAANLSATAAPPDSGIVTFRWR